MTFPLPPNEAVIVAEFIRLLDARVIEDDGLGRHTYAGAAGYFDERRNTSRVFSPPPGALGEAKAALDAHRAELERESSQLSIEEAA